MPKKSVSARSTAQRVKPKAPKNFELVREIQDEAQPAEERESSIAAPVAATMTAEISSSAPEGIATTTTTSPATGKVSAATRLAARRQAQQRQQRHAAPLITAEHYSYVRKDLLYTAILAVIMIAIIIVFYFTLGINA
ncbi:MAG TPA: hypothetical protein VL485_23885 [Ktedonobacteraceae bacterium]|jgi:hypothetical protein|nr:hypothetical protein [Ktedonobacteraceae bacterium]